MRFEFTFPHPPYDRSARSLAILRAAKEVFVRRGYAGFSIRAVARAAGASMGAVQNFFPTKERLVAAMLEYVVNEYELAYQQLFRRLPISGEARLLGALDYLVDDLWREDTRHFFLGLWALAVNHPPARAMVNEMYAHHRRNIAAFVSGARPALTDAQCYEAALVIAALIEGLILFTAPGAPHKLTRASLRQIVRESVLRILAPQKAEPATAEIEPAGRTHLRRRRAS